MQYISFKCPKCNDNDLDHITDEKDDNEVESCYTCRNCDHLVIFVFERKDFETKEWHEAPPIRVFTEER